MLTVIIPVFNATAHLREAVTSAQRAGGDPEIIIVDDGSTDGIASIAEELPGEVRYVRQENAGPAAARNLGLAVTSGDVVRFLDADDGFAPNSSERLLEQLAASPSTEVVIGYCQGYAECAGPDGTPRTTGFTAPQLNFGIGTALFRRDALARLGGFDAGLRYGEDLDLLLRAKEAGVAIEVIEDVTLYYRIHDASATYGKDIHELNLLRILKNSLDRRRTAKVFDGR